MRMSKLSLPSYFHLGAIFVSSATTLDQGTIPVNTFSTFSRIWAVWNHQNWNFSQACWITTYGNMMATYGNPTWPFKDASPWISMNLWPLWLRKWIGASDDIFRAGLVVVWWWFQMMFSQGDPQIQPETVWGTLRNHQTLCQNQSWLVSQPIPSICGLYLACHSPKCSKNIEPVEAQASGSLVAVRSCVAVAEGTWVMSLWMASAWVGMALNGTVWTPWPWFMWLAQNIGWVMSFCVERMCPKMVGFVGENDGKKWSWGGWWVGDLLLIWIWGREASRLMVSGGRRDCPERSLLRPAQISRTAARSQRPDSGGGLPFEPGVACVEEWHTEGYLFFFFSRQVLFFFGSWFYAFLFLWFSASLLFCFSAYIASLLFLLLCFSAFCFPCFSAFLLFCFSCFLAFLLLCFPCFSAFVLLCLSTSTILLFLHPGMCFLLLYFLLLCFFASCLYCLFVFHFLLLYSVLFVS